MEDEKVKGQEKNEICRNPLSLHKEQSMSI